jgi:hypothetical protein
MSEAEFKAKGATLQAKHNGGKASLIIGVNGVDYTGSSEEAQLAIDAVERMFNGKVDIKLEDWVQFMGQNAGGKFDPKEMSPNSRLMLQISMGAKGHVLSNTFHESLHAMVHMLNQSSAGKAALEKLFKVLTSEATMKRLEATLGSQLSAGEVKSIMDAARADPEEAAAYAFQMWSIGAMKVGPDTQGIFHRIANMFRRLFRMTSETAQAENFMNAFISGELGRADFKETALSKAFGEMAGDRMMKNLNDAAEPLRELFHTIFDSSIEAVERLESKHGEALIHMYAGRGDGGGCPWRARGGRRHLSA